IRAGVNMKIALKITPQRSTQYTHMTATLAQPELLASPLNRYISEVTPATMAGQGYLVATIDEQMLAEPHQLALLSRLGATSEVYEYFDQIGSIPGPMLRPIEPQFTPFVPLEMSETR